MADDPRYPPEQNQYVEVTYNQYVEVTYVTIDGAGGSVRRWLTELPGWLGGNPGFLIVKLRVLE